MALSRQTQRALAYGGNATLVTVLVVILVGVLYGVADRHRVSWDLSEGHENTLQVDTLKKLELLQEDNQLVSVTAFSHQQGKRDTYIKDREVKDLLVELDRASSVVETEFVDFDRERLTAEKLGVTEYGHIVVQRGEERVDIRARELFRAGGPDKEAEFLGEAVFNRAAAQLLSDRERVIYTLRGHGEKDLREKGSDGLSDLALLLEKENYRLAPLDFNSGREAGGIPIVPLDASAVLVAGPQNPLTDAEQDALSGYLAGGGAMMIAVDPRAPDLRVLEQLDVRVPSGIAADKRVYYPHPDRPVPQYGRHSTVDELQEDRLATVLSHIAPLRVPAQPPEWMTLSTLFKSSRDGWIDRGGELEVGGLARFEPEIDLPGPVTYAVAMELKATEASVVSPGERTARVMVLGDSDWMANELLATGPGNGSFAVNAFRWLVWDDARLSLVGNATAVRRLALTEEDQGRIRFFVVFLLPILILIAGGAVWASRRGR
ncbi:MAG: Gldg family protein [Myxococcota bacterium]|nr:Gldg family protein [Myxococcota bacterium]